MGQVAFITGATAGIGEATARQLASQGYDLILTGRRLERLQQLKADLEKAYKCRIEIVKLDVRDAQAAAQYFSKPTELLKKVQVLINNAGLAQGTTPMDQADLADWDTMIETNISGLLRITRYLLPLLKENKPAHIVNLGSVAGRWVYPGGGVYCATKHAVRALSEGLRLDLLGQDIRVTNISPGMVETEFSEVRFGDKEKAKQVYQGMTPLRAEDIAESISWSLSRPSHVNIQELVIYPTDQASVHHVHRG